MKNFIPILTLSLLASPLPADTLSGPVTAPAGYTYRWEAPTTREDGSPLAAADIAGYRLYCGHSYTADFTLIAEIRATSNFYHHRDEGGARGYCRMTVIDTGGLESRPSNIAGKPAAPQRSIFQF